MRNNAQPFPGEVFFKQYVLEEALRLGMTYGGIYNRIIRGKYPGLQLRRCGIHTIFVRDKLNGQRERLRRYSRK